MSKLLLSVLLSISFWSSAQNTCLPPSYFFNSKSRINGNGGVGSQYRFNNVLPGINAFITINKIQNASIDSNNMDNSASYSLAWQPFITFPARRTLNSDSSYIEFKVEFKTNTSSPVLLPQNCMAMTIVDCDGDGNNSYREFVKVSLPAKPMGVLNSTLSVFQDEKWILFKSGTATFSNIDTINKAAMGQVSFPSSGISSYNMRVGVIGPVTANTQRQFSFYFKSFAGLVVTLPVELIDFKAQKQNQDINLSWMSSREENFSHYELYRSYNGSQFLPLGRVEGRNTSQGLQAYAFTDPSVMVNASSAIYYRLKMVDLDGRSAWSHLLYVGAGDELIAPKFTLYPNPATNQVFVMSTEWEAAQSLQIVNTLGQTVYEAAVVQTNRDLSLSLEGLPSGLYTLSIDMLDGKPQRIQFYKL